jgi:hypothetical protein
LTLLEYLQEPPGKFSPDRIERQFNKVVRLRDLGVARPEPLVQSEIKFSKSQLQRAVISEVDRKIRSIAKPRNYTFRPVLIHVNGVDDSVLEERYFDTVIESAFSIAVGRANPKCSCAARISAGS